jgi:hypothetical protein
VSFHGDWTTGLTGHSLKIPSKMPEITGVLIKLVSGGDREDLPYLQNCSKPGNVLSGPADILRELLSQRRR